MGIIRTAISSVGGTLSDQWLEIIAADNMTNTTIMTKGISANRDDRRNQNKKGNPNVITDGSVVQVGEKQMMLLVDGGKIIDYSAEAGYFQVKNENSPSLLGGDFGGALSDAFNRFKFGGSTPFNQQVFFINIGEIQNIPFGTSSPISYFDEYYDAELSVRAHGYYSVKIVDPIKFYVEAASKNADRIDIDEFKKLYLSEFLTAFQTAIGKMSVDGFRLSYLPSKASELSVHMETILNEPWQNRRGIKVESVAISSITPDERSRELIDMRNQGSMLKDSDIRAGYVQGAAARGVEAAGSNSGGAIQGFIGVNNAMNAAGSMIDATNKATNNNSQPSADRWFCPRCGTENTGNFCTNCGTPKPAMNN